MSFTVQIGGKTYHTGLLPTPAATIVRMHRKGRLKFAHDTPLMRATPRAEYEESDCRHFFKNVKDQDGQSSCTGFSASSAMNGAFAKQGFDINVSAASIYCQINGGSDNGANVGDALDALQEVGCTQVGWNDIGDLDWKAAYKIRKSDAFKEEAKKFKAVEAVFCGSDVDAFMDGLATGMWAGQMCLGAGSNFDTDSNGWLPTSGPRSGINHALTATGGIGRHPKTGEYGPQGLNPWGSEWGDGGFFYCGLNWLRQPGQELWLCRATTLPE
jgi:hypothetical protein